MFDFGRSKIGTGACSFKHNWGFAAEKLHYRFRLAPGAVSRSQPLNPKYRIFIAGWKRLPLPVANVLGLVHRARAWVSVVAPHQADAAGKCLRPWSRNGDTSMMPDLLFLTQRLPYPPDKGEKIRSFQILNYLSGHYRIHLGCLIDDRNDLAFVDAIRAKCCDIHVAPLNSQSRACCACAGC